MTNLTETERARQVGKGQGQAWRVKIWKKPRVPEGLLAAEKKGGRKRKQTSSN